MKLEVGKAYRTRNGQKVTIVEERPGRPTYNFTADNGTDYTPSGLFWVDDETGDYPLDLVAEWDDLENAEFEEETPVQLADVNQALLEQTLKQIDALKERLKDAGIDTSYAWNLSGTPVILSKKTRDAFDALKASREKIRTEAEEMARQAGLTPPHFIPPLPSRPDPADHAPTLRDQFAMAALTGLLSDHTMQHGVNQFSGLAYKYADAMMAERAKAGA